MYKEIALDPECFKDFEYYTLLKTNFGHDCGRYVVAPTKEWTREAFQFAKESELSTIKQKSVTNFLNKLSRGKVERLVLLPQDRTNTEYADWRSWFLLSEQIRTFCLNISEQEGDFCSSADLDASNEGWSVPPSLRVDRTAADIFEILKPLCRFSKDVTIIDQYFSLSGNAVLEQIFQFIDRDPSSAVEKLTLVTSVNTKDPANVFANEFRNRFGKVPSFRVIVAPEKYFHDRYILSDYASLKTGQGFSEAPPKGIQADRLSYSICSKSERDETLSSLKKLLDENKALADDLLN